MGGFIQFATKWLELLMIVKLVPFHVNNGGAVLSAEKFSPRELTIRRSFEIRVEKCLRSFDELPDEAVEEFLPQFTQIYYIQSI